MPFFWEVKEWSSKPLNTIFLKVISIFNSFSTGSWKETQFGRIKLDAKIYGNFWGIYLTKDIVNSAWSFGWCDVGCPWCEACLSMAPPRCEIGRWGELSEFFFRNVWGDELSDGIDVEIPGIFHIFSISISDTFLRFRFDLVIHWDRISNKLISYHWIGK